MAKFTLKRRRQKSKNDTMSSILGISKKRADMLVAFSEKLLDQNSKHTDNFQKCLDLCDTLEEVVYIIYEYGHESGHICEQRGAIDFREEFPGGLTLGTNPNDIN